MGWVGGAARFIRYVGVGAGSGDGGWFGAVYRCSWCVVFQREMGQSEEALVEGLGPSWGGIGT